jgi:hypothetical protein
VDLMITVNFNLDIREYFTRDDNENIIAFLGGAPT